MSSATTLFEQLADEDVDWILDGNEERHIAAGDTLIAAGQPVQAISIVLEGLLAVVAADGTQADVVGPGDLVGEMSFVESETPSRSVTALESSSLVVVPHDALRARAESDPAFAGRLYRAFALLLSRRFRRAINQLAARSAATFDDDREKTVSDHVMAGLDQLKDALHAANRAGLSNGGTVPAAEAEAVRTMLVAMYGAMDHAIGDGAPGSEHFKEQMGIRIQKELIPYVLLSRAFARTYTKPRGYAGDYLTIEWMYAAEPGGVPPLGPLLDEISFEFPATLAVRNRRALLAEEITSVVDARADGEPARIVSLACGPAREIFDVFETLDDASALKATLIDFDLQALAHVAERRDALGLQRSMTLTPENLIHLSVGRKSIDLAPQDLIYSIGLIDYFPDELVIKLMSLIHSMLKPGGKAILGNFHSDNAGKAFMDHVLEWRLIHRTEEDMSRLYRSSAFGRDCTNIRYESQRVNMFAECVKG